VLTDEPDYSDYQDPGYNWSLSVYGDVREIIPTDIPEPKGKYVTLSHYFYANLYHNMVTGRSVTAILHFLNQTPMDWYSKKQATVETATFGSEFIAARTTIDQIIDLRMTLCYLGIPIREKSYVFGDNKTVINALLTSHAHSIVYERQSRPSMLRFFICRANTTLPTSSASTGLMLRYGEP
jgi:hypothetical protein